MVGERQGNSMGTAWQRLGMCESALKVRVISGFRREENEVSDFPGNYVARVLVIPHLQQQHSNANRTSLIHVFYWDIKAK
jgi:hypothetical protein